ncbi:uncharacterized protein LOC129260069 [Lytechinus pictus]|uniref:uncharacterized protein LOC129260069 n=1 Tax=Lytechinus pictus TaxID=7653 RepID=UPI0030BA0764
MTLSRKKSSDVAMLIPICPNGHGTPSWCSQETIRRSHIGDLKLASALILTGNNFRKVSLMAEFARLNFMGHSMFAAVQKKYVCPAVEAHWKNVRKNTIEKHSGTPVVVCSDGRNDSPGHSAQFLTYTLMGHTTKDVLNVQFVDKREVGDKSPLMEMKGFKDSLLALEDSGLDVKEVVTDAHSSIAKVMRVQRPQITHSWDTWHGAKNLGKKLSKASSRAATRPLAYWARHVVLHFWYCSKECKGDSGSFKAKWHGLTHHVTNKHSWVSGLGGANTCDHGPLDNPEREEWLKPGDKAH